MDKSEGAISSDHEKQLSTFDISKVDKYNAYWKKKKEDQIDVSRQAAGFTLSRVPEYKDEGSHPLAAESQEESEKKFDEYSKLLAKDLYTHWKENLPYSDLDGEASLFLMKKAGVPLTDIRKDVTFGPKGSLSPGKVNIDTSNRDGVISNFNRKVIKRDPTLEEATNPYVVKYDDLSPEEKELYDEKVKAEDDTEGIKTFQEIYEKTGHIDHHSTESGPDTSATKFTYEMLISQGLLRRTVALEKMVAFVTQLDNQTFPNAENHFQDSSETMLGLAEQLPVEYVYKFFLDGRNPLEKLSREDKKRYNIIFYRKKGDRDKSAEKKDSIDKYLKQIDKLSEQGFSVDSLTFGRTLVDVADGEDAERIANGPKMLSQAALARGYNTYVLWSPETNSVWISASNNIPEDFKLSQGENRRNRLWHKPPDMSGDNPLTMTLQYVLEKMGIDLASIPTDSGLKKYLESGEKPEAILGIVIEDEPEDELEEATVWDDKEEAEKAIEKSFEPGSVWKMAGDPKPEDNDIYAFMQAEGEEPKTRIHSRLGREDTEFKIVGSFDELGHSDEIKVECIIKDKKIFLEFKAREFIEVMKPEEVTGILSDEKRQEIKLLYKQWIDEKLEDIKQEEKEKLSPEFIKDNIEKSFSLGGEWVLGEGEIDIQKLQVDAVGPNGIEAGKIPDEINIKSDHTYRIAKVFGEEGMGQSEIGIVDESEGNDTIYIMPVRKLFSNLRPKWIINFSGKSRVFLKDEYREWLDEKFKKDDLDGNSSSELNPTDLSASDKKDLPADEENEETREVQSYEFKINDDIVFNLEKGNSLTYELSPGNQIIYFVKKIVLMPSENESEKIEIVTDTDEKVKDGLNSATMTSEEWARALKSTEEVKNILSEK